jgi:hypothetical protein
MAIDRVMKDPKLPPCVTNHLYPSTSVRRILNARAVTSGPSPDLVGAGEKPNPGMEGATTWKGGSFGFLSSMTVVGALRTGHALVLHHQLSLDVSKITFEITHRIERTGRMGRRAPRWLHKGRRRDYPLECHKKQACIRPACSSI